MLTFISSDGPALDQASAKAMRAHTTRANFRRRRHRLVQEYTERRPRENNGQHRDDMHIVGDHGYGPSQPLSSQISLNGDALSDEAYLIEYLTNEMEKVYPTTGETDRATTTMHSNWIGLLSDPTMHDVSLYFAKLVYAARLRRQAEQFLVSAAKGLAFHSVGKRLRDSSKEYPDSLVAAVLTLTILDQALGDIEGWKIHISGLLQLVTVRSQQLNQPLPIETCDMTSRAVMQGLILFSRHDSTILKVLESTGVFDTMFSNPGREAAYLILAAAQQIDALQSTFVLHRTLASADIQVAESLKTSLDAAIHLSRAGYEREAYLTAMALGMKIFLTSILSHINSADSDIASLTDELMNVVQGYEPLCPFYGLILCSSLGLRFWQAMLGAVNARDDATRRFFLKRLDPMVSALAVTSWNEAVEVLERFFWIPSIFDQKGQNVFLEVQRLSTASDQVVS